MNVHREWLRRAVELAHDRRESLGIVGQSLPSAGRRQIAAPRGIVDFWPDDLVVRVGAGTTLGELDRFLEGFGFELGVHAGDCDRRSVGECFARGLAGLGDEDLREVVLSALVIDGRGCPLELGARVVKNVAGYDLLRLHFGAGGGFAAIVELVLRVRARPEVRRARQLAADNRPATRALLDSRAPGTDSTTAELYFGSKLRAEFELEDAGSPWVLFAQGRAGELEDWARRVGGHEVQVTSDRLLAHGSEPRSDSAVVDLYTSCRWVLEHASSWLDSATSWWWLDARRAVLRLEVESRRWPELRSRLEGQAFVVAGSLASSEGSGDPHEMAAGRWLRQIKAVWDPAGVFPEPPRSLR